MKRDNRAIRSRHIAGSSADPTQMDMKSSPGGLIVKRQPGLPILYTALLAALCLSLLFLVNGGLARAQDNGVIEYAENGKEPVVYLHGRRPRGRHDHLVCAKHGE